MVIRYTLVARQRLDSSGTGDITHYSGMGGPPQSPFSLS